MQMNLHVFAYVRVYLIICLHTDLITIPVQNEALQRGRMFNEIARSFEDVSGGRNVPGVIEEFWEKSNRQSRAVTGCGSPAEPRTDIDNRKIKWRSGIDEHGPAYRPQCMPVSYDAQGARHHSD